MRLDYEVRDTIEVTTPEDVVAAFAEHGPPMRIVGAGSKQHCLPPPGEPVRLLRFAQMNQVRHFESDDLTCSVEPGLRREALDEILAKEGLCLPCEGQGTVGGLFAAGEDAPFAPGAHSTRSLLLGLEGVQSDGRRFKCGARVVKSVAGFDLHKLFVGSRGRLFAATLLHLKLQPRPQAESSFVKEGLDQDAAIALFSTLRLRPTPPTRLALRRRNGVFSVHGTLAGHAKLIQRDLLELRLEPRAACALPRPEADPGREILHGRLRPSHLPRLLAKLPASAELVVFGTGQIRVCLPPAASDELLLEAPKIPLTAELREASRERRGLATPIDPTAKRLCLALEATLDPENTLR